MSIRYLPKYKNSFLAWVQRRYKIDPPLIYSGLNWPRQRYFTHIKQESVFPRKEMALLAKTVGDTYSNLYKAEGAFYASKQIYGIKKRKKASK